MSRSRRELFGFHRPADTPIHRAPLALKAAALVVISVLLMLPFPWLLRQAGADAPATAWAVPAAVSIYGCAAACAEARYSLPVWMADCTVAPIPAPAPFVAGWMPVAYDWAST